MGTRPTPVDSEWEDVTDEWQTIQSPVPVAPKGPEGGSVERFLSGLKRSVIPSIDDLKALGSTAFDVSRGPGFTILDILKGLGSASLEQASQSVENLKGGEYSQAAGHALASLIPGIGPAAARAGEAIGGEDVAGGLGEASGLLLPFTRPFRAVKKLAPSVRESAGKNVARLVGATTSDLPTILDDARNIGKEIGIVTSQKSAAAKAAKKVAESGKNLQSIKEAAAETPINLDPVKTELVKKLKSVEYPGGPNLTLEQKVARINQLPEAERGAAWSKLMAEGGEELTLPATLDTAKASATNTMLKNIQRIEEGFGSEAIPAREAFKLRTQAGKAASRGGAYGKGRLPGVELSPGAEVFKDAHAALSEELKKAIPDLRVADMDMNTWKTVSDLLERASRGEALAPAPALEVATGRTALGALGAIGGGVTGGTLGGIVGGYGAWKIAKDILNSPFWNSLSATTKYNVAKQLGSGLLAKGTVAAKIASEGMEEE